MRGDLTGSETVLLVEDELAIRAIAAAFLKEAGYRVLEAANPEDALTIVKAHGDGISLLLTDVVMPGMNGRQLAEKICAQRPEIKVLYMSGYTDDALIRRGVFEAGISILEKPFSRASLLQEVREALARKT
jgi:two-component system, cell cycle sensor histidine kinase and response regulator CckA